jgi:hypothetical protein
MIPNTPRVRPGRLCIPAVKHWPRVDSPPTGAFKTVLIIEFGRQLTDRNGVLHPPRQIQHLTRLMLVKILGVLRPQVQIQGLRTLGKRALTCPASQPPRQVDTGSVVVLFLLRSRTLSFSGSHQLNVPGLLFKVRNKVRNQI